MPGIKISGTGSYLPEHVITNDDFSKVLDTSDEWISQRTGIKSRHKMAENEDTQDMAINAAREAIENAKASDPDFGIDKLCAVVTATITGGYLLPSVSAIIQNRLNLPENIKAFDLSAACTGFAYALQTGYEILNVHRDKYVLIVACEGMSKILDYSDRTTCVLFGDGAAAAVLKFDESEDAKFIETFGTRGDMETLYCTARPENGYVHMEGTKVFKFAVTVLKEMLDELLLKAGVTMDDIDQVICHQANARIIKSVTKNYKGNEDKFYLNIETIGNTSGASVGLVMDEMMKKGILKPGMKVLCVAFGAGLSWAGAYMTI